VAERSAAAGVSGEIDATIGLPAAR